VVYSTKAQLYFYTKKDNDKALEPRPYFVRLGRSLFEVYQEL